MIVATDPSTSIIGLAWRKTGQEEIGATAIRRIHEQDSMSLRRTVLDRVLPQLHRLHAEETIELLAIEVPPDQWKDDGTGRSKAQARVGVPLGRAMMVFEMWAYLNGVEVEFVPNGEWRASIRHSAWSRALDAPKVVAPSKVSPDRMAVTRQPPRRRQGGGWTVGFDGCEHEQVAKTLTELGEISKRFDVCPDCAVKAKTPESGEASAHKRPWVELAARAWPNLVARLVQDARTRAKGADTPAHALAGVSDACDALLLLQHVWMKRSLAAQR